MDYEKVRTIMSRALFDNHGGFLNNFIISYIHADSENEKLLYPVAVALIYKYKLDEKYA